MTDLHNECNDGIDKLPRIASETNEQETTKFYTFNKAVNRDGKILQFVGYARTSFLNSLVIAIIQKNIALDL